MQWIDTPSVDRFIRILFLAAHPSDAARLRLGAELRNIHERLRLSRERDQFLLESREAVRPVDITQAIFDVRPKFVHFSGHGTKHGELCFESETGTVQTVPINALSRIFSLVADQVQCVLLNACYTDDQARAIAQHIKFVIGMSNSIGDEAAIVFSTGFYKALGANQSIEKAYHFGCAEIELQNIPEHLTPVLYANSEKKTRVKFTFILKGTLDDLDGERLQAILQHLRILSGDVTLTLHKVEEGSIKITFKGSDEGLKRIEYLFKEGELSEIFDLPIQNVIHAESLT
ncbi:CHAT domain-containing protein [Nostoc sp.]|uniref:CHAT domain-containing protein n=1 Tax=Nostoc sp. TaxID=1180 RepID=UPI002FF8E2D5